MSELNGQNPEEQKKPGAGATIGAFFLCWVLGFICCAVTSMFAARSYGFSGYSTGGLMTLVVGICCAVYYHSSGKMGPAAIAAAIAGAVIGFGAVQLTVSMDL